jgi:hypothetical protein
MEKSMVYRYISMRVAVPSGGSYKVTIPMAILREVWGKSSRDVRYGESFPVCFIQSNNKIILELPENVLRSEEYSRELKVRVREDWHTYNRRIVVKEYDRIVRVALSSQRFDVVFEEFKRRVQDMVMTYRGAFSSRELRFVETGEIDSLMAALLLAEEAEKEEELTSLLYDVRRFVGEVGEIKKMLAMLDQSLADGVISKRVYEGLKERYLGRLALAEERVKRIREALEGVGEGENPS